MENLLTQDCSIDELFEQPAVIRLVMDGNSEDAEWLRSMVMGLVDEYPLCPGNRLQEIGEDYWHVYMLMNACFRKCGETEGLTKLTQMIRDGFSSSDKIFAQERREKAVKAFEADVVNLCEKKQLLLLKLYDPSAPFGFIYATDDVNDLFHKWLSQHLSDYCRNGDLCWMSGTDEDFDIAMSDGSKVRVQGSKEQMEAVSQAGEVLAVFSVGRAKEDE